METLTVSLGQRSYPIFIASGLLDSGAQIDRYVQSQQVLVITDEIVGPYYLEKVKVLFANRSPESLILKAGESQKNLETVSQIFDRLLELNYGRSASLVALGGGVIGDMTGFAAACYQRGISFMQIPTTLLAQVDSSVGGKTGVNHPLGKNMIGAFHQPSCVLIDVDTLKTLPDRELRSGLAEVIKYGLILDAEFLEWIEGNIDALIARDPDALVHAIYRSCACKADIVARDENEQNIRAWLNLGHTYGHAIESWQAYGGLLHGEAVSIGMVMAAECSARLGYLAAGDVARVRQLLERAGLPVCGPAGMKPEAYLPYMRRDKKSLNGKIRLVLLDKLGSAMIYDDADDDLILSSITACLHVR